MKQLDGPLHERTATELSALFQSGDVSPVEVTDACLAQYERWNQVLNAIVAIDKIAIHEAAAASASRWKDASQLSPLDGVPVVIKDNIRVASLTATWGSRLFREDIPEQDELAVTRLRAAGAIIFGKANVPELALAGYTDNKVFGATGNPWQPELTPGGSSGGAVAAIMSGMVPVALATDAGGSIRRPASHAGCTGLKTSRGLVPRRHGFPALAADFQTIGPLARSIGDLRLVTECIASALPALDRDFEGLRVAAVSGAGASPVDLEVKDSFLDCASLLKARGAKLEEIDPPYDAEAIGDLFMDIAAAGVAAALASKDDIDDDLTPAILALRDRGRSMRAENYVLLMNEVEQFRWQMHDFFANWDVMLTPTAAALPWPRGEPFAKSIAGRPASARASAVFTTFANVAGLPGLSIPFSMSRTGLPIGMQLVGPIGSDAALLSLGNRLEQLRPWPRIACAPT